MATPIATRAPWGLGSLYNHSEKPNARGTLDVRRKVLEFYAMADLYKGQEILVSYGDTYFDEDFAGHRKSELLHIEAPDAGGDPELQRLVELQRALIRAFTSEEFRREMRARAWQRQHFMGDGPMVSKELLGKTKSIHSLIMQTEQPILERFGYAQGMKGGWKMQEDLIRVTEGLDPSSEAVRNNAYLEALIHEHDPPPPEYWETVELELVILGTEVNEQPEVFRATVPKKAPCGFVRFLLSQRFPQSGMYSEERVWLVGRNSQAAFFTYKDSDLLPIDGGRQGRLLVSGMGDVWPRQPQSGASEELTDWQIVRWWIGDEEAQQRAHNFRSNSFKIAGTWDDFKGNDMDWDGSCFVRYITLTEQRWESFQILQEGRWETTLYPDVLDASPWVKHKLLGPDNKGHGKNWMLGRHSNDTGDPGTLYKVELRPDDRGVPGSVHWKHFASMEQAAEAQLATKHQVRRAAAEQREREILDARMRARDSEALQAEWAMRRQTPRRMVEIDGHVDDCPEDKTDSKLQFDFDSLEEAEAQLAV